MGTTWSSRLINFAAVVSFAAASLAFAQPVTFTAMLSGANEGPPSGSANTGTTLVTIDPSTGAIAWTTSSTIPQTSATGHHIHRGVAGASGSVVVNFGTSYSGVVTATTALASEILGNPSGFYVNLHTAAFPAGEIRGQLATFAVYGAVPMLELPLLGLLGLVLAGFGAFVVRRRKQI